MAVGGSGHREYLQTVPGTGITGGLGAGGPETQPSSARNAVSTARRHRVGVTNIRALAGDDWAAAAVRCPKHMTHGPCAGVRADLSCEVPGAGRCSYLDVPERGWPYAGTLIAAAGAGTPIPEVGRIPPRSPAAASFLAIAAARPVVVADLVAPALSADGVRACAAEIAGFADACLTGDHPGARVQFPPSYRARLLADEGVTAWAGINCRDRNRVALEGEIAACADAGVAGVHCVTGDHPGTGHRADAAAVFDLDSTELVALARTAGAPPAWPLCSVAHAPAAPPEGKRLARLLAKIDAGADVVFVDHCGGTGQVADAVDALREVGFRGLVLCCVPVVTSAGAAEVVASFAAGRLPPGYLDAITGGPDPAESGVTAAVHLAEAVLAVPGVDGVNLSAGAAPGQELAAMRATAEVSRRLLGARQVPE
jgi:5,10-methylenetetrahydrofolate reductase